MGSTARCGKRLNPLSVGERKTDLPLHKVHRHHIKDFDVDFLLQLRNAAKECSKPEWVQALKQVADDLDYAVETFRREPTEKHLIILNGIWACAWKVLKSLPPEGDPAPLSGSPDEPLLQMAV